MSDTLAGLNAQIELLELERMIEAVAHTRGRDLALARLDAARGRGGRRVTVA